MVDSNDSQQPNQVQAQTITQHFVDKLETDPDFREQIEGVMRFVSQINNVCIQVAPAVDAFARKSKEVANQVEAWLQGLVALYERLPKGDQHAEMSLAQESWFISPDMIPGVAYDAAELFVHGAREEGDRRLTVYFTSILNRMEGTLTAALPTRAALIRSAFSAHRRGEYDLAIPVLLAQTDGVCSDCKVGLLFLSQKGAKPARPQTAVHVDTMQSDDFWADFLRPLGQKIPINYDPTERKKAGYCGLNRNMVMHGESLAYGTEINSLKCISLLSYAAWVLKETTTPSNLPPGPNGS